MTPAHTRDTETILAVDDDPNILRVLDLRLSSHGYRVLSGATVSAALALARENRIDLAVLDYKLNGDDGVVLMEKLHQIYPGLPVIILTAYGTIANAVDAMKRGAVNYLVKPFDGEDLVDQIANALAGSSHGSLEREAVTERCFYEVDGRRIIAASLAMRALMDKAKQVAQTGSNVFIQGESGTGKELIARFVHAAGKRKKGPFIAVNCAAIPENLLESELLGHEKGAFTGADSRREGLFTQADKGSFFFDEISELPFSMQAKLLRILEEKEFYPLGSSRKVKVDVRILAASNRDLEERVRDGRFREDLFYRIRVIPIVIPPLRKRLEDIPPLSRHFLGVYSLKAGKTIRDISPPAVRSLMDHHWPGNVRELENLIEYAVAMAPGPVITPDLFTLTLEKSHTPPPLRHARDSFEKDYLVQLMEINSGNVSQAAEMAGKYRADFYGLLRKHGLDPRNFRHKPQV